MADSPLNWNRLRSHFGDRAWGFAAIGAVAAVVTVATIATLALRRNGQGGDLDLLQRRITSAADLDRVHSAFAQEQLGDYRVVDGRILVPRQRRAEYWRALEKHEAFPSQFYGYSGDALDGGIFTPFQEKVRRLQQAREREVALAIEQIPAVESALVLYDEMETGEFPPRRQVTAMVSICCREGQALTLPQVEMIRTMVASAKAGLMPEDVDVSDVRLGRVFAADASGNTAALQAASYLQLKKQLEQHWHDRIVQVLDNISGARVTVSVELANVADPAAWSQERVRVAVRVPRSYIDRLLRSGGALPGDSDQWQQMQQRVADSVQHAVAAILPESSEAPSQRVAVMLLNDQPARRTAAVEPAWRHWLRVMAGRGRAELLIGAAVSAVLLIWFAMAVKGFRRSVAGGKQSDRIRRIQATARRQEPSARNELRTGEASDQEDPSREALLQLVRQDPDRAARVLNDWIRQAG